MWNEPKQKDLDKIPRIYSNEEKNVPLKDQLVHMHFFMGGSDWWVTEFDGDDLFFGFARLNADDQTSEWGYISLKELKELNLAGIEVDRDLYWNPKPCSEIPQIKTFDNVI
jgi:hypothetical protein